jgi:hypothetical protein
MAIEPKITIEEAYEVFENPAAMDSIPVKSQGFVKSLLAGKAKYGSNSIKQQHWVRVYAEKVQQASTAHANPSGIAVTVDGTKSVIKPWDIPTAAAPLPFMVGNALHAMLTKAEEFVFAKGGKKRPQIKFSKSPTSPRVAFKIASLSSKYKGSVMVTSGGAYGQSSYFGNIHDGIFTPAPKCTDEITEFVVKFATNPHKMGSAYGLATMHCCFCSRPIDTVDSKTMGYGPVCASKFGLPWGAKATKSASVYDSVITTATESVTTVDGEVTVTVPKPIIAAEPSKWIALDDSVKEMQKLADATGVVIVSDHQFKDSKGVSGFAKIVAATGVAEPEEPEFDGPKAWADAAPPEPEAVAQDFGFTCEICMDTGKDITPEGVLVDCGGCK